MNSIMRRNRNKPERAGWNDPFSALQRQINDLFNRDFWDFGEENDILDSGYVPAMDIRDSEDHLEIRCDLPGVDKKDINVSVSDNILTVKGEKKGEKEEKENNYYRKESWSGTFQRSIQLPEGINPDKADAQMKDGVLSLKLPKVEPKKKKQIEVKVS